MPEDPPEMDEYGGLSAAGAMRRVNELIAREHIVIPTNPEERSRALKHLMVRVLEDAKCEWRAQRGQRH
jgi:hypothetical protein